MPQCYNFQTMVDPYKYIRAHTDKTLGEKCALREARMQAVWQQVTHTRHVHTRTKTHAHNTWPDKIKANAASVCSRCKGLAEDLEANLSAMRDCNGELMVSIEGMRQQERCLAAELVSGVDREKRMAREPVPRTPTRRERGACSATAMTVRLLFLPPGRGSSKAAAHA